MSLINHLINKKPPKGTFIVQKEFQKQETLSEKSDRVSALYII